jgi:hypothetical protein
VLVSRAHNIVCAISDGFENDEDGKDESEFEVTWMGLRMSIAR